MAWSNGLKPLATIASAAPVMYFNVGLGALILNIAVAAITTLVVWWVSPDWRGVTAPS